MIRYTFRALGHLQDISTYLDTNAPEYSDRAIDELFSVIDKLSYLPKRGVPMPELLDDGGDVREIYHYPYRIAYLIEDDTIVILAITHMRMNRIRLIHRDCD